MSECCVNSPMRLLRGVTRTVTLTIKDASGVPLDLSAVELTVEVIRDGSADKYIPTISVEGEGHNLIVFTWPADKQKVGLHTIDVRGDFGATGVSRTNWHGPDGIVIVEWARDTSAREVADLSVEEVSMTGTMETAASASGGNYYIKPDGGIPSSDMTEAVQQSLALADSALQSFTETDPTVPAWAKAENKPSYTAQEVGALPADTHIPADQVQSDWNESDDTASDYIKNKPDLNTLLAGKADKVTSATNGNFAALDSNGNLTDSGHKHSDYITSHQDISGKADKVSGATSGNFAALDGNGNLTDSGHKHGDYLTSHQSVTDNNPTLAWNTKSKVATIGSTDIHVTMPANPNTDTQSDWNETDSNDPAYIKNKPNIPAGVTPSSTTPKMDGTAAVGSETAFARGDHVHPHDTSKQDVIDSSHKLSYTLLSDTPTIPAAQVQTDWNASSGMGVLLNKPTLATVATSGSYNDLSNKPTIPTVPTISTDIDADATSDTKTASPKAVKTFVEGKGYGTYSKPSGGIPASDLASGVIPTVPTISTDIQTDKASTTKTAAPSAVYNEVHPAVQSSQPNGGFLPNVVYDLGTITGTVTFALAAASDATIANAYFWTFETSSTAPTITWPANITSWFGGSAPTINASKHYEISLLGGVAIAMEA